MHLFKANRPEFNGLLEHFNATVVKLKIIIQNSIVELYFLAFLPTLFRSSTRGEDVVIANAPLLLIVYRGNLWPKDVHVNNTSSKIITVDLSDFSSP